jgi:hypothetical protein
LPELDVSLIFDESDESKTSDVLSTADAFSTSDDSVIRNFGVLEPTESDRETTVSDAFSISDESVWPDFDESPI